MPLRRHRQSACTLSAQETVGKASSSKGISSQRKRRTSRLSGPADTEGDSSSPRK
jgi:hypothetical protein